MAWALSWRTKRLSRANDPESPGDEDSAFGAVPEPATAALLLLGGVALAARGLRRA